ncbi:unnamed protein product, partial [Rhizoctonia solani]
MDEMSSRDSRKATNTQSRLSSPWMRSVSISPPPLMLARDVERPLLDDMIMRTPSPITYESGSSRLPLNFSFISSLPEYNLRMYVEARKELETQRFDKVWQETAIQWEGEYGTSFPYLKDKDFRHKVQQCNTEFDNNVYGNATVERWKNMWLLQFRNHTAPKLAADLRKEGIQRRVQSWVETGIYHRESMEFWEKISVPREFRDLNGTRTAPPKLEQFNFQKIASTLNVQEPHEAWKFRDPNETRASPELEEFGFRKLASEPNTFSQEPYGLWERNGRWRAGSGSGSSVGSVASIKDALYAEKLPFPNYWSHSRPRNPSKLSPPNQSPVTPPFLRPTLTLPTLPAPWSTPPNLSPDKSTYTFDAATYILGGIKKPDPEDEKERQGITEKREKTWTEEQAHQEQSGEPEKDSPIIGIKTPLADMISYLTKSGCQDLTQSLNLTTFSNYPVCHGGLSDVYRGYLNVGTQVAVKALRISQESIQNAKHFKRAARELHTWSSCQHRNVLQLLGLAVFQGRIGMVSPWIEGGDLPRYLKNTPDMDRCNLCTQICDGLAYLHGIGIIHGDLKGANILVLPDGTPVLADFGNSILLGHKLQFTETTQRPGWTVRWAAPELLNESDEPSEAADVYALGMTILQFHGYLIWREAIKLSRTSATDEVNISSTRGLHANKSKDESKEEGNDTDTSVKMELEVAD